MAKIKNGPVYLGFYCRKCGGRTAAPSWPCPSCRWRPHPKNRGIYTADLYEIRNEIRRYQGIWWKPRTWLSWAWEEWE